MIFLTGLRTTTAMANKGRVAFTLVKASTNFLCLIFLFAATLLLIMPKLSLLNSSNLPSRSYSD